MGKGDKRSRRGKITAGSFGKTRPKNKKRNVAPTGEAKQKKAVKAEDAPKPKAKKVTKKVEETAAVEETPQAAPEAAPEVVAETAEPVAEETQEAAAEA